MNLRIIGEVLGILVILGGAVVWYHEMDNEVIEESVQNIEGNVLKFSLKDLYQAKCNNGNVLPGFMWDQMQKAQDRHMKLNGREYDPAPCK